MLLNHHFGSCKIGEVYRQLIVYLYLGERMIEKSYNLGDHEKSFKEDMFLDLLQFV